MTSARNTNNKPTKFAEWLQVRLDVRHWTRSDLARASDINPTTLTNLYYGRRNASWKLLKKIAIGLDIPAEIVYHANGLIEIRPENDDLMSELLNEMKGFNVIDKEEILEYVRMKRKLAEKHGEYTAPDSNDE